VDNLKKISDEKLVTLSKKDLNNFSEIVLRYEKKLFFYVKRISYFGKEDIEDILQNVFIKTYQNIYSFDCSMKFSTWIYQITRNATIDAIRKKSSRPKGIQLENQEFLSIFKSGIDLEKETISRDDFKKIKKIIDELPFDYKEIIILKFLEEKSYEEIMDIVRKPKGTIASLINRARKIILKKAKEQNII